ncbi:Acyl protein thioesterase 1 [Fasciola hepatica]|uniref:palmitoyl-protein hydrolase n=1 Tax=Fasciola hepatica TaxID=6192 RepID=A0A4E0RJZ7_FASHE|nr:Acyl protein thioesterase 1 [Fasciola hepatica]
MDSHPRLVKVKWCSLVRQCRFILIRDCRTHGSFSRIFSLFFCTVLVTLDMDGLACLRILFQNIASSFVHMHRQPPSHSMEECGCLHGLFLDFTSVIFSRYDIYNLQIDAKQDEKGIMEASAELDKFIAAEISNGIPAKRIVIGGFSQGGSVALYHALTSNRAYGGVIALSSWLPLHSKFISDPSLIQIAKDTAVFQGHGSSDYIVAHDMGRATHELLKGFQLSSCEFCSYDHMGHSSCEQEMDDVKAFLKRNIPAT